MSNEVFLREENFVVCGARSKAQAYGVCGCGYPMSQPHCSRYRLTTSLEWRIRRPRTEA